MAQLNTYYVWDPTWDTSDSYNTIEACSAYEAVKKWAEKYDKFEDFTIVQGSPMTVSVKNKDSKERQMFSIWGEFVPHYHINEVEENQ